MKNDFAFAAHMLDLATVASSKCLNITKEQFDADENLRLAATHLIQTIGEAARQTSSEFRKSHASIPWTQIIGMRHKVVHDYMHVDYDLVWDVCTMELPSLITQLETIVSSHGH